MRIFLVGLALVIGAKCFGQYSFRGQIVDPSNNEGLPFVNVLWWPSGDSTNLKGVVSDPNGYFQLESLEVGNYQFKIQMIGYQSYYFSIFLNQDTTLEKIFLHPMVTDLEEIVIRAEQSYLEVKPGKKVFFVGNDISTLGSSVAEVLETIPSVTTNAQGDIRLRGSSNFAIFINGKQTNRDARSLRFLNVDALQRIEVITNPSAKYDAEGVSGIINLVFRKRKSQQLKLDGNVNGTLPARLNTGINISLGSKQFSFYTNGTMGWSWYENSEQQKRKNTTGDLINIDNLLKADGIQFQPTLTTGLNYQIDTSLELNLEFNFTRWDLTESIDQLFEASFQWEQPAVLALSNMADELENEGIVSFQLDKVFKPKKQLKFLFSLGGEDEFNEQLYNQGKAPLENTLLDNTVQLISNEESQRYYRLNLDFQTPLERIGVLETGTQVQLTKYEVLQNLDFFGNTLTAQENNFIYNVWKPAIYALITNKLNRLEYEAGIRVEYFQSEANQVNLDSSFQQTFFNVFPSFGVLYTFPFKQSISVGLNYTRRINTPGFFDINPFVTITDPLNQWAGNPNLRPEFSSLWELNILQNRDHLDWTITLFNTRTRDIIQQILQKINENSSLQTYRNFGKRSLWGTEIQLDIQPSEVLKCSQSFAWNFTQFDQEDDLIRFNRVGAWQIRLKQQLRLKKDWIIDLSEFYRSDKVEAQAKDLAQFFIDIGIRKSFGQGKGTLTINWSDIFNTRVFRSTIWGDDFTLENRFKFQTRRITLGMKYKLVGN